MVAKYAPFFTMQPLPTKQRIAVRLGQVFGLLANQMVGAITASSIGNIRDPNTPALSAILLGDNQRGGAYPLFVRLVYPTGTEDSSFPLHVTLTRGATIITTARRSAIVVGEGGRVADYEVLGEGGISVGTWPDGFASIGQDITVDLLFETPPEPEPDPHYSYTIVAGTRSPFIGYWDNNIGTINGEDFSPPGQGSREIRQSMYLGDDFRWLIRGASRPDSNFPTSITAVNGANSVTFTRPSNATRTNYGQGTGIDYDLDSGNPSAVFVDGATITINLFYE